MNSPVSGFQRPDGVQLTTVHDLRNLFCVITSAARLLRKGQDQAQGDSLLSAIEEAAFRGGHLAGALPNCPMPPMPGVSRSASHPCCGLQGDLH